MAKKRSTEDKPFDLFPFFSVLVCSIGVLALIIVSSSIASFSRSDRTVALELVSQTKGTDATPIFVECRADHIVIQPQRLVVGAEDIDLPGSEFVELLNRVEAGDLDGYVMMAVYPDGVNTFYRVRELVESRGIQFGFEPIEANWQLVY